MDALMTAKRSGTLDADFAVRSADATSRRGSEPTNRLSRPPPARTSPLTPPCYQPPFLGVGSPRESNSTRSPRTSTRPRCFETNGSSAPRSTPASRERRRVQGASPAHPSRAAGDRTRRRDAGPAAVWVTSGQLRGNDLVVWTDDSEPPSDCGSPSNASAATVISASPTFPLKRQRRRGLRRIPCRDDGITSDRARTRAVRCQPLPRIPPRPRTRVEMTEHSPSTGTAESVKSGIRGRGRTTLQDSFVSSTRWAVLVGYPACPELEDQPTRRAARPAGSASTCRRNSSSTQSSRRRRSSWRPGSQVLRGLTPRRAPVAQPACDRHATAARRPR